MRGNRNTIDYVNVTELNSVALYNDCFGSPTEYLWEVSGISGTSFISSAQDTTININSLSAYWINVSANYNYIPVVLTIYKDERTLSATKTRNIYFKSVIPYSSGGGGDQPVADFTFDVTAVEYGFYVEFFDQSTGATSYVFEYGDGTSADYVPEYYNYYASAVGTQATATLTINNGASSISQVISASPSADFSYSVVTTSEGYFDVSFTNNSKCVSAYNFDFGDETSATEFPTSAHRYYTSAVGTSAVTSLYINNNQSLSASKTITITPNAYFIYTIEYVSAVSAYDVTFINSSVGVTSYNFDFGDGTSATEFPTSAHRYSSNDIDNVSATLVINGGIDSYTKLISFNNPIIYWEFNEGSGSTISDTMGNAPISTIVGATWVSGITGSALHFNATEGVFNSGDYIQITDSPALLNGTILSIIAWVKPEIKDLWYCVVGKQNQGETDADWSLRQSLYGGIYYAAWDNENYNRVEGSESFNLPLNEWSQIVGVISGNEIKTYINGIFQESSTYSGQYNITDKPIFIGCVRPGNYHFKGTIDSIALYNRSLTEEEILQNYNNNGTI